MVLIEIEKRHSKRNVDESISYIKKHGYKCFYIKNKKLLSSDELLNKESENNYLFLPI